MPGPAGRAPTSSADRGILERDLRIGCALHAGEKGEGAILELHHDALERGLGLVHRQLEQLEDHRLVPSQHLARSDAEQEAVADLASGAGDGDADGWFHRELLVGLGGAGGIPGPEGGAAGRRRGGPRARPARE
jgi:hypothetical protein